MTPFNAFRIALVCLSLFATVSQVYADDQRGGRRGPPPQAIEACASLTEGDACSFTGRNDEELTGVCFAPSDRELACKPEGHDQRMRGERRDRQGDDQTL